MHRRGIQGSVVALALTGCSLLTPQPGEVVTVQSLAQQIAAAVTALCAAVPAATELATMVATATGHAGQTHEIATLHSAAR